MPDIESYYTVVHSEEFTIDWRSVYSRCNELTDEVRAEYPHVLDEAYGTDHKQRLDVYVPRETPAGPVLIFLHGGGMREGDRRHYGYVARPFLDAGILTVVASYRLAPRARFPEQPEDVHRILRWTHDNIDRWGGDPSSLVLSGHSAGAILTGYVGADRSWMDDVALPRSTLRAIAPISGSYDLTIRSHAYLAERAAARLASPMFNVVDPPTSIVAVGGDESTLIDESRTYADRLRAAGDDSMLIVLDGADHADTVLALGDDTSAITVALVRLFETFG